jgi:prefoldin beta subunit
MADIPQKLEQQLMEFQQFQKQAQVVAQQRLQFEIQLKETEKALSELSKLKEKSEVYKSVGAYLIKSEKEPLKTELQEKKEALGIRIKTFKNQEEKYTSKLQTMKTEIESQLQGFTPTAG